MVDRSALVRNSFESSKSFERKVVWVVRCSGCGRVYSDERGVVYFDNIEDALDAVVRDRGWWVVRECGLEVICSSCYWKLQGKLEDEVSCELLV